MNITITKTQWGWKWLRVERLIFGGSYGANCYYGIRLFGRGKLLLWLKAFDPTPKPAEPVFGEGPGFSPDGGRFWRKGGKVYWNDGDVTEDGGIMRETPYETPRSEWHKCENYSEWSDEKRAAVQAETQAHRDAQAAASKRYLDRIEKLCKRARKKLTRAEYSAVYDHGYNDGRYWP